MLFDSHFHLTDEKLFGRSEDIIKNFSADGICGGVEIGANAAELPAVFAFAETHENIYCTAGVHPMFAKEFDGEEIENFIKKNINNPKFVALGECGLDFHRPEFFDFIEKQKSVFAAHIMLAHKYKKPLVVHSRDAADLTLEILNEYRDKLNNGVLIHCMSYCADFAASVQKILPDVYFAFGGAITYGKNLEAMAESIRAVPAERILIETDAPYLTPEPVRGKVNEPKYMAYTARRIAEILNLTVAEVARITTENAKRFYGIV
jgi:TatD DNase family protein